ncbi:MAG: nitroreductase family protein [Gemmiger sp.]|nr:nitroreductase family protein [Gemmiger sp.]
METKLEAAPGQDAMMEFLRGKRTYRRFLQQPVPPAVAENIVEAARIASCGANRQSLKYLVVQSPAMVAKVNGLVHWAAYLPPAVGTPKPGECPTLFVAVLQDAAVPGASDMDVGIALAGMTDAAWAAGVGSCIMGAIDRPALTTLFALPEGLRLSCMVAFGYPAHHSHLVEMQAGSVKYYLDEASDYCVPKRPTAEILLGVL